MATRMIIHGSSSFLSDALAVEVRKSAILRDAGLPDAPLVMPRQVIETSRQGAVRPAARGLNLILSLFAQGFGRTARGR